MVAVALPIVSQHLAKQQKSNNPVYRNVSTGSQVIVGVIVRTSRTPVHSLGSSSLASALARSMSNRVKLHLPHAAIADHHVFRKSRTSLEESGSTPSSKSCLVSRHSGYNACGFHSRVRPSYLAYIYTKYKQISVSSYHCMDEIIRVLQILHMPPSKVQTHGLRPIWLEVQ